MAGSIAPSKRDDWCTPPSVVEAVLETFGERVQLDPCSNAGSLVNAMRNVYLPEDGLSVDWTTFRNAFVNPPYQPIDLLRMFVWKCREAGEAGVEIIGLIPSATETRHFQDNVLKSCSALCLPRGRLKFWDPLTGARSKHPQRKASAIPYWGKHVDEFVKSFSKFGAILKP